MRRKTGFKTLLCLLVISASVDLAESRTVNLAVAGQSGIIAFAAAKDKG